MANRLLAHEWILFRNAFLHAFARKRDRALLGVMAALGLAWLTGGQGRPIAAPAESAWLALLGAPIAFAWQRLLLSRLQWFAQESPLAAAALSRKAARGYLAAAHALVLAACAAAAAAIGNASGDTPLAVAILLPAYGAGLALGTMKFPVGQAKAARKPARPPSDPPPGRRRAVLRAVLRSQTLGSRRPEIAAAGILAANIALTATLAWIGRGFSAPAQVALILLPSLATLLATSRADAGLLRFLPSVGYGPLAIACAVSALPLASFLAAATAAGAGGGHRMPAVAVTLGLLHAGFILPGIARAWLYPGRHPRSVDLQVQAELAGLMVLAVMLPPMAALALPLRMAGFYRRHRALTWTQA